MSDFFGALFDEETGVILYSPQANRLFIFKYMTFFQLPALEREDGKCLLMPDYTTVDKKLRSKTDDQYHLDFIGFL